MAVTGERKRGNDRKWNGATEEAGLFFPLIGRWLARSAASGTSRAKQALRPLFPIAANFDFERESFSDAWSMAILRKCGDVDKDLRATLGWRDEAEASIIIPFRERAFNAHMKGLTSELRGARCGRPL